MSSASSRSSEPLRIAAQGATARLVTAVSNVGASNPVVLIDGRSGAGKSTIARDLVSAWPLRGRVQLIALDSIYPGWDGLADGVDAARELILNPHARGLIGVWQRWDWVAGEWADSSAVDPSLPLIVEGAGIITPVTARLSDIRAWVEAPTASRKRRALARDGDAFRPHWTRWALQEEAHIRMDDPVAHATVVLPMP